MNREIFQLHFSLAVAAMRLRCEQFITNTLPSANRYYIILNASYDGNPLHQKEKVFSDHAILQIDRWMPYDEEQVIERLWRDGYVPVWIDVTPYEEDGKDTYFELRCAGRFSNDEAILYHQKEGYPPFHRFGPIIPSGWKSDSPKFDLNHYRNSKKGSRQK